MFFPSSVCSTEMPGRADWEKAASLSQRREICSAGMRLQHKLPCQPGVVRATWKQKGFQMESYLNPLQLPISSFFSLLSCQILPTCAHLNCPLIAAETTTVRAAGKQRGKEPGEEDDLHQQLVNAEHLLGSHKPRSLLFQLAM